MKRVCGRCQSTRTVAVLDVRLTRQPGGGNPYRARCLECASHYIRIGKDDWANHSHPHVLPRTADADEKGAAVPLWEYDDVENLPASTPDPAAVIERSKALREEGYEFEVVELEDGDEADEIDESGEEEPSNRFECPADGCEAINEGKPEECPGCGAPYSWT